MSITDEQLQQLSKTGYISESAAMSVCAELLAARKRIAELDAVVSASREYFTATALLRFGDASEDDHYRAVCAGNTLHDLLKELK